MRSISALLLLPAVSLAQGTPEVSVQAVAHAAPSSSEQQPARLGFASHLPADVDLAFSLVGLGDFVHGLMESETFRRVDAEFLKPSGFGLDDVRPYVAQAMHFVGSDVFVAMPSGAATQMERLMVVQSAYDRITSSILGSTMRNEEISMSDLVRSELEADDRALLDVLDELSMLPLLVGTKLDAETAHGLLDQLAALEHDLPPFVQIGDFEVAPGQMFRTWRISLGDAMPPDAFASLADLLGPDLAGELEGIARDKQIEVAVGTLDGMLIASIGADRSHLEFERFHDASIQSLPEVARALEETAERPLAFNYISKGLIDAFRSRAVGQMLSQLFGGMLGSLETMGADFGESREHLNEFGRQIDSFSSQEASSSAGLMWIEDGLRGTSVGGIPSFGIDGERPLRLARVAPENALLAIHSATTPEGIAGGLDMLETLAALGRDAAYGIVDLNSSDPATANEMHRIEGLLMPVALDAWDVLSKDVIAALGGESAFILDLDGDLPLDSDMPAVLQREGRGPRLTMLRDVKDREALSTAWNDLLPLVNEFALRLGEVNPDLAFELPPARSAGGGHLRSHFFDLPIEHGGFLPALTLGDTVMAMGTSRRWNEALVTRLAIPKTTADTPRGTLVRLRFDALHEFVGGWFELVNDNLGPVFGEDIEGALEFRGDYPDVQRILDLTSGLGGFTYSRHREERSEGRWQSHWHLEIEDLQR